MAAFTETEKEEQWTGSQLFLCALLQLLLVHIAYRIDRAKGIPIISTASCAILFGVVFGGLLSYLSRWRASQSGLDPQILFFGLLPPIILEAGFNTQRKGFFSNFLAIGLLALAGTIIATVVTGGLLYWIGQRFHYMTELELTEALQYGALVSAIDPIATLVVIRKSHAPSLLFNLLFGESVTNDAVAIVLCGIFQNAVLDPAIKLLTWRAIGMLSLQIVCVAVGSVLLAAVICYTSAFFLRHADPALRQHQTYEISTVLLTAYASYMAGQSLQLSGLLAVFFSGVFIRHYHMYNISHASATTFRQMLDTISFLAENFIYIYLGASLVTYSDAFAWDWKFILTNLGVCLVARALNTFPLCALANAFRARPIPWRYMLVMWFAGLRGSITFALALNVRTPDNSNHAAVIRASALVTVISTTLVCGSATGPLLRVLRLTREAPTRQPESASDRPPTDDQSNSNLYPVGVLMAMETTPLMQTTTGSDADEETGTIRHLWVAFDEKYLKPVFGGKPRPPRA